MSEVLVNPPKEGGAQILPPPEELLPPGKGGSFKGYGVVGGKHGLTGEEAYTVASHIAALAKTLEENKELRGRWEERYGKGVVARFIEAGKELEGELEKAQRESYKPGEAFASATKALQELYNAGAEKEGWSFTVSEERWGQIPVDGLFGILTYRGMERLMERMAEDVEGLAGEKAEEKLAALKGTTAEEVVAKIGLKRGKPAVEAKLLPTGLKETTPSASGRQAYQPTFSYYAVKVELPDGSVREERLFVPPSSYERSAGERKKHREFAQSLSSTLGLKAEGQLFQDVVSLILSGEQDWIVPSKGGSYKVILHKPVYSGGKIDHYAPMTRDEQREFVEKNKVKHFGGAVNRYASLHKVLSGALREGYVVEITLPDGRRVIISPEGAVA